jgi:hypothetical protein
MKMLVCRTSPWIRREFVFALAAAACALTGPLAIAADDVWSTGPAVAGGQIVFRVAAAKDEDPAAAGKAAAEALKKKMGAVPLKAVIVSECFEDKANKEKLLAGIGAVLPRALVTGGATYGSFTQEGCEDADAVCLLGIGGDGIGISAALVTELGTAKLTFQEHREAIETRLRAAGSKLAGKLARTDRDRLVILIADAHAPKNQALVEGVQQAVGKQFAVTGGCANKNAGQTFVYFAGRAYEDSALALMLSGDFTVGLAGRQARENDKVISTAREGAAEALAAAKGRPFAVLAFDCAGRRSKLKKIDQELAAVQQSIGRDLPLFGCYCAGEIGPVDSPDTKPDARCGGSGWHVMFSVLAR